MESNQNTSRSEQSNGVSKDHSNHQPNKHQAIQNDLKQDKNHQIGEDDETENQEREITANAGKNSSDMKAGSHGMKNTNSKDEELNRTSSKHNGELKDDDDRDDASEKSSSKGHALDINDKKADTSQKSVVAEKHDNSKSKF